ncbi:hypothetical protein EJ02DRAFT_353120 [Clathrospora elynae]|uniref:Mid2 domain-containing protein n=1 Tax=Clathrospora elynae TaxID=706981 RepID=A0A6A5SPA3_9PLEO|nr:hypothetical protein EJ02DRAFT_353120 [Clathrospora elynae]
MVARLSLISIFAMLFAIATSQQCYGVDGTALDKTYIPCNLSAKHSGCCASKDICLSNGLCMATTNEFIGTLRQSGCTDATGKDAACPKACPSVNNDFDGFNPVSAWSIQTCDYGRYCCRALNDRRSCCKNSTAPQINSSFKAILQLQTSTTTAVSTGKPLNATATRNPDVCKKERQDTAIVGGTIGAIFGAIIMGLAATILCMHKRERRQRRLKEHYEEQFSQTNAYRKALASSASSLRGSVTVEGTKLKSSGPD